MKSKALATTFVIELAICFCGQSTRANEQMVPEQEIRSHPVIGFGSTPWRLGENEDKAHPQYHGRKAAIRAVFFFESALHKQSQHDFEGAIADYQAAIKIQDTDPTWHWYLGTAYKECGKFEEAKREFAKENRMNRTENVYIPYGASSIRGIGDFGSSKLYYVPGNGLTPKRPQPK